MQPDPTPAEIDAGARALYDHEWRRPDEPTWDELDAADLLSYREAIAAVLRAVLPDHDARLRARLDVARAVADHWRAVAVEHGWIEAGHALCCVLAALDGETDPTQLGISDGYPDADHIAQHTTIREDSDA